MEPSQWRPPHDAAQPYGPRTGPPVVWAVLLWSLACISLVGSLIFAGIAYAGYWSNSYLDSYGVTTTATVTDVQTFTDTVTVEFTSDGGTPVEAEIVWFAGDVPDVGDEIAITYDPSDPSYATEAGSDSDIVMAVVFLVGAVLGLVVVVGAIMGAVLVHRRRGKAARQRAAW